MATSSAYAINDLGQIVGVAPVPDGQEYRPHAHLWSGGTFLDLNTASECDGCELGWASAINAAGQITANGGQPGPAAYGYLLTPWQCTSFATCDSNCDGEVNFFDIDPFNLALFDPSAYVSQFPSCNWLCNNDVNHDGNVDFFDIDAFLACIF